MQEHTHKYFNAGLCVLPAIKDEKRPAIGRSWKEYKEYLPTETELDAWFASNPDAMCIVTGAVSGNLEIIDFDHQATLYQPWAEFVKDNMPGLLEQLVIETTQSGGKHVIYRYESAIPGNLKLARRRVNGKPETFIETRGEGGLFLCCPTPGYELIQGNFENLPTLTEKERSVLLTAASYFDEIETEPEQYKPRSAATQYDGRPGDDYNARADVREILRLYGWTYLGADSVNERWRRPGKDKGSLSATLRTEDQRLYVFSSNAAPFEPGKSYLPFAVLTLLEYQGDYERAASQLSRQGYGQPMTPQSDNDVDISGITNPPAKSKPVKDTNDPGLIPEEYFYEVPGFIHEYMKHCVDTMPYKRAGMAFCGAMACLSWLTGRKVKSPAGIRTNLYILGIAGSGGGKDWARKINGDIFEHVGASSCLGKDFASGEGLEDKMLQNLCMLFQTDEIDAMLQCIKSGKEGRYERLMASLLSFYTSSDSIVPMRAKAGQDASAVIKQPHLTLFGTATTENFYGAFNERMLTNGLFSRMMIIDMGDDRGMFHQPGDRENIPEAIKEAALFWNAKALQYGGNLSWENPQPVTVPYSGNAGQILMDFQRQTDGYYRNAADEVTRVAWTRAGENARKLALLYACSESHTCPQISEVAATWAMKFITHQIKRQLYKIGIHYADSPFHKLCLKAVERIRRERDGTITRSTLSKYMKVKPKELDDIINALEDQERIESMLTGLAGKGRPARIYRLLGK